MVWIFNPMLRQHTQLPAGSTVGAAHNQAGREKKSICTSKKAGYSFKQASSGSMAYIINLIRQSKGGDIRKAIAEKAEANGRWRIRTTFSI